MRIMHILQEFIDVVILKQLNQNLMSLPNVQEHNNNNTKYEQKL